jgi:hypothetical protein
MLGESGHHGCPASNAGATLQSSKNLRLSVGANRAM